MSKARQTRARRKIWERRQKLAERRKARAAAELLVSDEPADTTYARTPIERCRFISKSNGMQCIARRLRDSSYCAAAGDGRYGHIFGTPVYANP